MDGENNGKPIEMDDFGGTIILGNTHVQDHGTSPQ